MLIPNLNEPPARTSPPCRVFDRRADKNLATEIVLALKDDQVALIENVSNEEADLILSEVAHLLGLKERLEAQALFASILGHRENVSQYFMTVNSRDDGHFISPHSEGGSVSNIQISSLYCHENTTDGGETILFNTNQDSSDWGLVKEVINKIDLCGKTLSKSETALLKATQKIHIPRDILKSSDSILGEIKSPVQGVKIFESLSSLQTAHSVILERNVNVLWDTAARCDFDCSNEYINFLTQQNLIKLIDPSVPPWRLDNILNARKIYSGIKFNSLFRNYIVRKLKTGDLIIQNNLTWAHAANNWTPGSGVRRIVAAFA